MDRLKPRLVALQTRLENLAKDNYYYTYYDKKYILYEPLRYLNDVFSVSFNFWFSKQEQVYPCFYFINGDKRVEYKLNTFTCQINDFSNTSFGPFQSINQSPRPTEVYLALKTMAHKIIFLKHHRVLNYEDYNLSWNTPPTNLTLNLMLASCWSLPGYRSPAPLQPELYNKLTATARSVNADFVLSVGDIIYAQPSSVSSDIAMQASYAQLKTYPGLQGLFSNSTWLVCNDDHELSSNDGQQNSPIIRLLRSKLAANFPLIAQVSDDYRANITTAKNITFITLDTVSCRKLNAASTQDGDAFLSILGPHQLEFLLDGLSSVAATFGENGLCIVMGGKSMFGRQSNATFMYCLTERTQIFNHIRNLQLKNVVFICGDSHFSDVSQFELSATQRIREIRCSAIGSEPRKAGDVNEHRLAGSLVTKNNFGTIQISGLHNSYTVTYTAHSIDGSEYTYSWNTNA
jgi:hypothetical protein